jgi:hypothetical protein
MPQEVDVKDLATLQRKRDAVVRGLWLIFREMSDVISPEEFTREDLALWSHITTHSAVQSILDAANSDQDAAGSLAQ